MKKNVGRAVIEVGFIIFLFYSTGISLVRRLCRIGTLPVPVFLRPSFSLFREHEKGLSPHPLRVDLIH